MIPNQNRIQVSFADCVLDFASQQLLRNGKSVSLEPKMYQLLELLVQRRPSLVSNEELDEALWPNVYVARTSLTRLVSELRSLLGDNPRESTIIRTVYKRGYAFCADTAVMAQAQAPNRSTMHFLWGERSLPVSDGEWIVGRGDECSLVIDAETVSRRHARLTVRQGTALIEDLSSTNGTFVDGNPVVVPTPLANGNEVSLGGTMLIFKKRNASAVTLTFAERSLRSNKL